MRETFDAIVIGSGIAGGWAAKELSEKGLSVLVRTHDHALVYDAGPAPRGGVDAGASVVAPSLAALGMRRLDALVISHGDNDHAGGARALVAALAPESAPSP